jgi:hypothetical protein
MNKSTKMIITAAALAGLYAGSFALRARAADDTNAGAAAGKTDTTQTEKGKSSCNGKASCSGQDAAKTQDAGKDAGMADKDKSSCGGKNGCSGTADASKTKDSAPASKDGK